jgi:hypothetical protein
MQGRGHPAIGTAKPAAKYSALGGFMSRILALIRKWNTWYRVLRHGKGFSFADSLRYGLWLARG